MRVGSNSIPAFSTASRARGFNGSHVGSVDPGETAAAIAPPERNRRHVGERAQRRHLADHVDRLFLELGEGPPLAGQFAQPQRGASSARASGCFEQRAGDRAHRDLKADALAAKLVGGSLEFSRALRQQPRLERKELLLVGGRARAFGQSPKDARLGHGGVPNDRALVVGIEQRLGSIERGAHRSELRARGRQLLVAARAHEGYERAHRSERDTRGDRRPHDLYRRDAEIIQIKAGPKLRVCRRGRRGRRHEDERRPPRCLSYGTGGPVRPRLRHPPRRIRTAPHPDESIAT